jgi:hypothetical protein
MTDSPRATAGARERLGAGRPRQVDGGGGRGCRSPGGSPGPLREGCREGRRPDRCQLRVRTASPPKAAASCAAMLRCVRSFLQHSPGKQWRCPVKILIIVAVISVLSRSIVL